MTYSRKLAFDYCYKITEIKGGVINISDSQIRVTKLTLGYGAHGERYEYVKRTVSSLTGEDIFDVLKGSKFGSA